MYQFYSTKKYPSLCTCCIIPKYFKNKFDAYYHLKRKPMAPKKQKSSPSVNSSSNEETPQSIGKKRSAPKSRELELFYGNCDEGGIIFNEVRSKKNYQSTIASALQNLSKEDKMHLIDDFTEKSKNWKKKKSEYEEHYAEVYACQTAEDWKGYVEDFKKQILSDGILGEYIKSDEVLKDEKGKLESIIEVIENEQAIRKKVGTEKIWRAVISQIENTDLRPTVHYEINNTPRQPSLSSSLIGSSRSLTREVSDGDAAPGADADNGN
jgi:hypothetical protein